MTCDSGCLGQGVELLRRIAWLDEQNVQLGDDVEISVPECGIDGTAQILSIAPCPPIRAGPGQIVTGTFHHQSATILDLHISGLSAPLGTTVNHPFWSQTRVDFVRADQLQPGDRLRTLTAIATLLAIVPRATSAPVYNLEVQHAHIYHVATNGVLVHNGKTCKTLAKKAPKRPPNLTPKGAGRRGAFRQAKSDAGIPRSQQPKTTRVIPDRQRPGNTVKEFDFEVPASGGGKKTITIQEHLKGHDYGPRNPQNRGRHLNGPDNTHYDY